nr:hypothetical protein [uncultured Kingella sp.]
MPSGFLLNGFSGCLNASAILGSLKMLSRAATACLQAVFLRLI